MADAPEISVTAASQVLATEGCEAARRAVDLLHSCGMRQVAPIVLRITEGQIGGDPGCFGEFNGETDGILLLSPGRLSAALPQDHALGAVPTERLFASIITHELAHAFLYQMRGGAAATIAEDEYVAYAMQYLSLSNDDREAILQAMPGQVEVVSRDMLNEMFLALAPEIFGSWAWRHFQKQEDGCAFIREIIAEEVDFSTGDDFRRYDPHGCGE